MKKILTIVLTLLILVIPVFALEISGLSGFTGYDYYTWFGKTTDNVTIYWDAPEEYIAGDKFQIQIKNPERNISVNIPETAALNKTFKCPKLGHWIVCIRTKRIVSGIPKYSSWKESTDAKIATVDGKPRGWWLYTWVDGTK